MTGRPYNAVMRIGPHLIEPRVILATMAGVTDKPLRAETADAQVRLTRDYFDALIAGDATVPEAA